MSRNHHILCRHSPSSFCANPQEFYHPSPQHYTHKSSTSYQFRLQPWASLTQSLLDQLTYLASSFLIAASTSNADFISLGPHTGLAFFQILFIPSELLIRYLIIMCSPNFHHLPPLQSSQYCPSHSVLLQHLCFCLLDAWLSWTHFPSFTLYLQILRKFLPWSLWFALKRALVVVAAAFARLYSPASFLLFQCPKYTPRFQPSSTPAQLSPSCFPTSASFLALLRSFP